MTTINDSKVSVQNDEEIGPQIDITMPTIVEIKYNGSTLWINVDEVCRLRISKARDVRFDVPGLTQREVEG